MSDTQTTLNDVLDRLESAGEDETVTVSEVLDGFGGRTLAPVLLVPALMMISPLSGIPGMPTLSAAVMGLIVVQMLLGRDKLWLPQFLGRREVTGDKVQRAVRFLRKPVGWVDRLLKPRMSWLAGRPWNTVALLVCLAIVLVTPIMELLPFVATLSATAIGLFAAGILIRDGVVMLLGYVFVGIMIVTTFYLV